MGVETTPNRAMVQGGGQAFRMKAKTMLDEFRRGVEFQHLLLTLQALITQISLTAVCNYLCYRAENFTSTCYIIYPSYLNRASNRHQDRV